MSYTAGVDRFAIVGGISPAVASANTYNSDVVDMRLFNAALVVVSTGAYGASGATFDVTLYANTANSTSGGTAITGKSFTDATFSGSAAGANSEGLIYVTAEEVAAAVAGGRYLYAAAVVATNTVAFDINIIGVDPRYGPASDNDIASVKEIVS